MAGRGGWHGGKEHNSIVIGIVKANDDPYQMGRLRVHIPNIDHEDYDVKSLSWAMYMSPFGGVATNYVRGPSESAVNGSVAYGLWAIPKVGAQVLVAFINGDANHRVWIGCVYAPQSNRGMPFGRTKDSAGPFTDAYTNLEPSFSNLKEAISSSSLLSIINNRFLRYLSLLYSTSLTKVFLKEINIILLILP